MRYLAGADDPAPTHTPGPWRTAVDGGRHTVGAVAGDPARGAARDNPPDTRASDGGAAAAGDSWMVTPPRVIGIVTVRPRVGLHDGEEHGRPGGVHPEQT